MNLSVKLAAVLAAGTFLTSPLLAHETTRRTELFKPGVAHAGTDLPAQDAAAVAVFSGYGDFGFDPGTDVAAARAGFEQGIALLWGFNHAAAAQAFRAYVLAHPGRYAATVGVEPTGPDDPLAVEAESIASIGVLQTWVGGARRWEAAR